MKPPLRYPSRRRCRKCRRYLVPPVIDGQWCSYPCAEARPPSSNPNDWPRRHFQRARGVRVEKVPYSSAFEALAARGGAAEAYLCDYCLMWHRATARTADPC